MSTDDPLTVFFDAACPVCALEMNNLRRRDTAGRLILVDISQPGFDPGRFGFQQASLDAVIHAIRADGSVFRGLDALHMAYSAAGIGWVLLPTRWALLRPIADAGYRAFARTRRAISRALGLVIFVVQALRARRALRAMTACRSDRSCATLASTNIHMHEKKTS